MDQPIEPRDLGIGRLFGTIHEAIVVMDVESGRVVLWNPAAERVFGYSAAEMVGRSVERIIPPEFIDPHRGGLACYRATGHGPLIDAESTLELPARRRDGSTTTIDLSLSRLEDTTVPGRFVLAIIRDVSDRRAAAERAADLIREQAARAAAEAAEHRQAALAHALDRALAETQLLNAIHTAAAGEDDLERILTSALDRLRTVVHFTGAAIALLEDGDLVVRVAVGPAAESLVGQRLVRDHGPAWQVIDGKRSVLSNDLLADPEQPAGPLRSYLAAPLIWRGTAFGLLEIDAGHVNAFTAADRDLLEKTAAALSGPVQLAQRYAREVQALAEAEAARRRLAFLVETSALLVSSLDTQPILQSVADLVVPQFADWCFIDLVDAGGSLHRVAARFGVNTPELLSVAAPDAPVPVGAVDIVAEAVRTGHSTCSPSGDNGAGSAGLVWMCVPFMARGQTLGAITFVQAESGPSFDLADLRLAEALARRCALAIDNARLYQETQHAVELRNEFFSSASHDLKSPLSAIKGLSQMLRRRVSRGGPLDQEALLNGLDRIDRTTTRMRDQIDELLDIARLETGQPIALGCESVDLVALSRHVIEEVGSTTNHTISLGAPDAELVGLWDPARLRRVIENLLSNAVKYSPDGGPIDVRVHRDGGSGNEVARLVVRDHGLGIPESDLPRVFERFQRARNVRGQIAGSGIGLHGARRIVEQHGGTISLASREGVGSTFTVRLPLAPPDVSNSSG